MENLENKVVSLLNSNVEKSQTVNVYLTLKDLNLVLIDAPFETLNFEGGLRDLAIIVNRITKPFKDAPKNKCFLLVTLENGDNVSFIFEAGKFSVNLHTIINFFVQRKLIAGNKDKDLAKQLKSEILGFFNDRVQGFIKTLQFLDYIDSTPLHEITIDLMSVNLLKTIEANDDAK